MKPKVGLYLRNRGVADVDLRSPEKGNPGVGGTQFNFVTLPYYLQKYYQDEVDCIVYANAVEYLPPSLDVRKASSAVEAARCADEDGCNIFVYVPTDRTRKEDLLGTLESLAMKAVVWAHNVPYSLAHMDLLADHPSVFRFVVVGRERLDQIRDHSLFEKSRCIYNGFDPAPYTPDTLSSNGSPTVAYVGSLIPPKGFHLLAKAWPEVKRQVKEANLVVIGSGQLYDRGAELGKWGIAAERYEKRFRPYLSNGDGEVHSSVDFKGTLGTEKIPLLQNADVGVVNPSGKTENCPGSAIEFQAAGTPVVSIAEWGLLDTVKDGETGILMQDSGMLGKVVADLLRDRKRREEYSRAGMKFVRQKFSQEKICGQWQTLLQRVTDGRPPKQEPMKQNVLYRHKWFREGMRLAKKRFPFLRWIPPLFAWRPKIRNFVKNIISKSGYSNSNVI